MNPTNQDIVDAAKRAGINLSMEGTSHLWIDRNIGPKQIINLGDDSIVGSALFIVAVLGVLRTSRKVKVMSAPDSRWACLLEIPGDDDHADDWATIADTLTEACAHALVAAFPAPTTISGGEN